MWTVIEEHKAVYVILALPQDSSTASEKPTVSIVTVPFALIAAPVLVEMI